MKMSLNLLRFIVLGIGSKYDYDFQIPFLFSGCTLKVG